jgi:hypothetical protein
MYHSHIGAEQCYVVVLASGGIVYWRMEMSCCSIDVSAAVDCCMVLRSCCGVVVCSVVVTILYSMPTEPRNPGPKDSALPALRTTWTRNTETKEYQDSGPRIPRIQDFQDHQDPGLPGPRTSRTPGQDQDQDQA